MLFLLRSTLDLFFPSTNEASVLAPPAHLLSTPHATVPYVLHRAKRRTIGFQVGPAGLVVRAPVRMPMREIDAALHSKANWIVCKLGEMAERETQRQAACVQWCGGVVIPYLGQPLKVVLDSSQAKGKAILDSGQLLLGLPQTAAPDEIRCAVQAWLMQQAKVLFPQRLDYFAPMLEVRWSKLSLSQAKTRWGSAHSNGSIRLNWRLLQFPLTVIDYVVVHELSHLREMNHSPKFWATVAGVMPDYAVRKQQLKDDVMGL